MAELLLSAFFQTLFDKLASTDFLNFVRQLGGGVDSELKRWEKKLKMIQAVLHDAEEKELVDEAVKLWLDDLRDLAYDAEDILDEFGTQALKRRLMADDPDQPTSSRVRNIFPPACFSCFSPSTIEFNSSMRSKIESISGRLEELFKQRIELGLQLAPGGTSSTAASQRRPGSSSVPTERAVYGRDDDKAKILEMVLSDEPSVANFRVIPIVGMAGVGKTTLAREVYNDKAIVDYKFDLKVWVCVSDNFDVLSISRALLESITSKACHANTLNEVQVQLQEVVDGKKFLIVLDDVWNEDYSLWEDLKAPFLAAAPYSQIILTTRLWHVALTMGPTQYYNLKLLADDDCWSLFMKHAFEGRDINALQISALFRKKVIKKCGGLPLAAKTLGGLLRSKRDDAWEDILNSKIWDLPHQRAILPVLRLSYHHLPSHLKKCFAYCAIFPKDYEFEETELVFLWMAEGIIRQSKNNKQLEDWGSECFHDLVSRSIFQQSSVDSSKFVIHDLVHDLAQLISGETIFRLEEAGNLSRTRKRVRHTSYPRGDYDNKNKFQAFNGVEHLRTFLPVVIRGGPDTSYISDMVLCELLPRFKKLRVLSLEGYYITRLPNSITSLRLLTYLNLSGTKIRFLPESTSSLLNLEILILRGCSRLIKLPSKMRKLINLHHLDIRGAKKLDNMPLGMKELKNLQTLSNFIVGKSGSMSGLKDLKDLKFLRGALCISGLENIKNSQDAREAVLSEKQDLEVLSLEWGSQFNNSRDEVAEENALDMLQPHKRIKVLTITQYGGKRFPSWIGDPLFSKMEVLKLENCENCISLPSLGSLGSLKDLTIRGMMNLRTIGSETNRDGCSAPFQSLEILHLENLPEWVRWETASVTENEHVGMFPHLHELSIMGCPKLSGKWPQLLPSLEKLVVSKCPELVVSVSDFPLLCRFEIDGCKGLMCGSSPIDSNFMKCMTISNSALEIYGCRGMVYNNGPGDSVTISNILEFGKQLKGGFEGVESLVIGDSIEIKSWWQRSHFRYMKPVEGLHVLTHPEEVSVEENCTSLVSFPELKFHPNNLRSLKIENSKALKSLPGEMMGNNAQLETLNIGNCDSLTFIARGKLPSSLKRLKIRGCKNLQLLVDDEEGASSFSSSSSPVTLKLLVIYSCPELTRLSSGIQLLKALEELRISKCQKLESIPAGLHNLQRIWIDDCEKLEALPSDMHKLNSLRRFSISECPSIVSFPEEGFPTNLAFLRIGVNMKKLTEAVIQWGLHRLTSLARLWISECDEEMGMMLPTSLSWLILHRCWKLKCLSSMGFQSLTSLKYLWIDNCPSLASFPEAGLPSSLLRLKIDGCQMLRKECKRGKGKEWSKIANIPCVEMDGKFIHDPDSDSDSDSE